MRRARSWRGINLSVSVRLFGYMVNAQLYPFGTMRRFLLMAGNNPMSRGWHFLAGPLCVHGYYLGPQLFELGVDVSRDPFWGEAISLPPGYRLILGVLQP